MKSLSTLVLILFWVTVAWADTKISALPDGGTVTTSDQIPVNRGGTTNHVVVGTMATRTSVTSADLPALTGDATSSAGSSATTVVRINGTSLAALTTGLLKNTTGTGVPSIAVAGTDYPGLASANTFSGILTTTNGEVQAVRVVTAAGAVTAATTDRHICVNKTTGAATTVNLFATPVTGTLITVDDCKGDGATNNLTLTPAAGNIDGAATYVITTNFGSWTGIYTGTIWKTEASR